MMNNKIGLFPQGYAIGDAFYNRDQERERLKALIARNEHSVIVAPRRYGKTSLINQVLLEMEIPGKRLDLLPATNVLFVNKAIKSCFAELFSQIAPKSQKAKQALVDLIKDLHPKLALNIFGQKLEIGITQQPEESITDLLVGLNAMAKNVKRRVVICFDEFQQIGELKNNHAIEASIRHAVESSTHIAYVFSGSNRHLLNQMFSSKGRPLYHLCELMKLDRINVDTYVPILREMAKQRWDNSVSDECIFEILNLTKCHPYYVNALCRHLWRVNKRPSVSAVQREWLEYVETQSSWISDDFARLTPNQRNIIAALAYRYTSEPYGNEFASRVKMGASSIKKSISTLVKNDFIYRDTDGYYKVLDPAMDSYLRKINYFDFLEE